MKNKKLSKFLSVTLAILMCLLAVPVTVVSAEDTEVAAEPDSASGFDPLFISVNVEYDYENPAKESHGINGMCYIFRLADGSFVIYDGGWGDAVMCNRIYNLLKTYSPWGAGRILIGAWIITHPHQDHFGAIQYMATHQNIYKNLQVEQVIYSFPTSTDNAKYNELVSDNKISDFLTAVGQLKKTSGDNTVLKELTSADVSKMVDGKAQNVKIDIRGTSLYVLYIPENSLSADAPVNSASIVTKFGIGGKRFLFTGDMTGAVAADLIESGIGLGADYYQVPHHGCLDETGKSEQMAVFYQKTGAKTMLFPASTALYNDNTKSDTDVYTQNQYLLDQTVWIANETKVINISTGKDATNDPWNGTSKVNYRGTGTEDDPYLIRSAANLAYLNAQFEAPASGELTKTSFTGKHFKLMADINCNGKQMRLGTSAKLFGGTFDGNGHTVSNFSNTVKATPTGLFAQITGGTVKNLCIDNAYIKTDATAGVAGGIVGRITGGSQIVGCTVLNSNVVGVSLVGGIVGFSSTSTVSNCVVSNTKISNDMDDLGLNEDAYTTLQTGSRISSESRFAVAGIVAWSEYTNINSCINYGTVKLNVADSYKNASGQLATQLFSAGGIVGHILTNATAKSNYVVENCINYGSVSGTTATTGRITVGGIAGRCRTGNKAEIKNCYNLSTDLTATGAGTANLGMINGCVNNSTTLTVSGNGSVVVEGINSAKGNIDFITQSASATVQNTDAASNFISDTAGEEAVLNTRVTNVINTIKNNRIARVCVIGAQTKPVEGSYSVRFLLGLDSLETYSYYKFVVTADYTVDGVTKQAMNGNKPIYTVYETVKAGENAYSAVQLGTNYIGAMEITDIPERFGKITFTIQAYVCVGGTDTLIDTVAYSCGTQN